jgi:FKBP-type peptidyl-prolyl cis-trans isomerase FkpA
MRFHRPLTLVLAGLLLGLPMAPLAEPALEDDRDKALYAIGAVVGRQFQGLDLSPEEFEQVAVGLRDAALRRQIRASAFEFQDEIKALHEERRLRSVDKEARLSREFLDGIASQESVVRTESGLLFQSLSTGSGAPPGPKDRVRVHYEGHLRDGALFDSTRVRGSAAVFPLETVIPCWTEGLQRMRVGGRARIVCPASIAYGASGYPPNVPPNAPLDFEVELLEIER